jgi:hypothetical protein
MLQIHPDTSYYRLGKGRSGWSRQENIDVMPAATKMAGVQMRLESAGYRELHWHVAAEWSIVLNGSCRIQVGCTILCVQLPYKSYLWFDAYRQ